jgi:hypothetical protein
MISDWVSFLACPNLFGIKGFVIVVVVCSVHAFYARLIHIYTNTEQNIAAVIRTVCKVKSHLIKIKDVVFVSSRC